MKTSYLTTKSICIPKSNLPKVVVIGADFAGINFIKKLKEKPVQLIIRKYKREN
jgi:NADH dehydrogenase